MAKVSIATSVYNKEPYLERCLDSIINQTFDDIEIIIVDNASTDNSPNIIDKYVQRDTRIKLIRLKKNIGPAGGNAVCVDNVTTDYFTICDADDYLAPNYIEVLYSEMVRENADIVMCTNDYVYADGNCRINKRPPMDKIVFRGKQIHDLLPQLLDHKSNEYLGFYLAELGVEWARLYRTGLIKDEGINYEKDARIWSDWLFNFRVLKKVKGFVYTEQTIYHNFMSNNSTTRSSKLSRSRFDEIEYVLRRFAEECKDEEDPEHKLYKAQNRFSVSVILSLLRYYKKYFKSELTIKEEIEYLKKICRSNAVSYVDVRACGRSVSLLNKIRLFLLKHRIIVAEVMNIIIRGGENEFKE